MRTVLYVRVYPFIVNRYACISVLVTSFTAIHTNTMLSLFHTFKAADPSIGRFDANTMTDQMRMELLIANISEHSREMYTDDTGDYLDVCSWNYIECNSDGRVTMLSLSAVLVGTVALEFTPPLVTSIDLAGTEEIEGTLQTSALPENLRNLDISMNQFAGTVDMTSLPKSLTKCDVSQNFFSGDVNLTALPSGLQSLFMRLNCFGGNIALDQLPNALVTLNLSHNVFQGSISLRALPQALKTLNVHSNSLSGELYLQSLPPNIENLRLSENKFSGSISLEGLPPSLDYLDLSENCLSGSLRFANLAAGLGTVKLNANTFTGELHVPELPEGVHVLDVKGNSMSGTAQIHSSAKAKVAFSGNHISDVVDENGAKVEFFSDWVGYADYLKV